VLPAGDGPRGQGFHRDWATAQAPYPAARVVKPVDGVGFSLEAGETFGPLGESCCGKTATSKLIPAAEEPMAGRHRPPRAQPDGLPC
jgi:ABC-type glutathione transport system ATPase component